MELKYMTEKEVNSLLDMKTCIGLMNNVFTAFAEGKMENKLRENEVVEDLCLDGLKIIQNKGLYRFTSDAVKR